jgi:hypothetical protein
MSIPIREVDILLCGGLLDLSPAIITLLSGLSRFTAWHRSFLHGWYRTSGCYVCAGLQDTKQWRRKGVKVEMTA